jgi:hypothetical protein
MTKMMINFSISIILTLCIFKLGYAQHRGDNLAFQGFAIPDGNGVKALAMGGAYTAISGGAQSLFWNPAGLVGAEKMQISFQVNSYNKMWRENQVYRPSRQFVVVSFILDGLYVPDPAYNGLYDYEVFKNDTNYTVKDPLLGEDYYSEKAADWQKEKKQTLFDNFAIAVPFELMGKYIVTSAAYSRRNQVLDYDRNQTHLVPHLGYTGYEGILARIETPDDSVRVYWSDYERERFGTLWNLSFAVAAKVNKHVNLGFGFTRTSGETDDFQGLGRVGYFDLVAANVFRFSYDTLSTKTTGNSKFSALSFNIGAILDFEHVSLGLKITPPYTIKRKWNYTTRTADQINSTAENTSGKDKTTIPLSYAVGVSFTPVKTFRIAVDMQNTNYSQSEFTFANGDSTHRGWVDQNLIGIGIEYKPWDWLSLLGGYRNLPEVFVPDGAAIKHRGPYAESFTLGLSVKALFGWFDVAYETRRMKYYDSYYSNTNYVMETLDRMVLGYTVTF